MIDFRSDTVTRPTIAMREAMNAAQVGDDVFGEDPCVNELEAKAAALLGMEAALFCPSGTMTNQIAIRVHTAPGDEVICDQTAHIYQYEGGGIAANSGASVKLLAGERGLITAGQVAAGINNKDDVHKARTSLVCLENTSNRGGGSCYEMETIKAIGSVCSEHDLKFHLDGARLFNALVAKGQEPEAYGRIFHSVSICLSKGLGCPVGSVLLGSGAFIRKARRVRKLMGGGMRQAGSLAAAGIYALGHHIDRLAHDHAHAQLLAQKLQTLHWVESVLPVETNIIIFAVKAPHTAQALVDKLKEKGVLAYAIAPMQIRLVLHLDISEEQVHQCLSIFEQL